MSWATLVRTEVPVDAVEGVAEVGGSGSAAGPVVSVLVADDLVAASAGGAGGPRLGERVPIRDVGRDTSGATGRPGTGLWSPVPSSGGVGGSTPAAGQAGRATVMAELFKDVIRGA